MRKPNYPLGFGLLLMNMHFITERFSVLPPLLGDFLAGVGVGLCFLGLLFCNEERAARIKAWKRNLFHR